MNYSPKWNISTIPDELLWKEVGRRRALTSSRRAPVLVTCPKCQRDSTARERRRPCPCGHVWTAAEKAPQ